MKTIHFAKTVKIIAVILVTAIAASTFCGCSAALRDCEPVNDRNHRGNYYTVEQAKEVLRESGYHLEEEIETVSEDGYFYYAARLAPEEYRNLSVTGTVELTATYEDGQWSVRSTPKADYTWHVSGSWFAETEHYDVYMDVDSCDGSVLSATVEAQYDSTEGGKGSYGKHSRNIFLKSFAYGERKSDISDVYLYCEASAGYPLFQIRIEKDAMYAYQLYDSFEAVFTQN